MTLTKMSAICSVLSWKSIYLPTEKRNDLNVIKAYVSVFDEETLWATLNKLKAVLALDPFPAEWIIATTNLIRRHFEGKTHEEKTYNWLQ